MTLVCLIPPVAAFVLLAAHFFRAEHHVAALASLLLIVLAFVPRPWAARAMQVALLLGSVEWLRSAVELVAARSAMGQPFLRLAIILGGATLLTALSALVFRAAKLRARFRLGPGAAPSDAPVGSA